jgi:hypothetical protein
MVALMTNRDTPWEPPPAGSELEQLTGALERPGWHPTSGPAGRNSRP